jgi:hypothetical protein
MLKAAFTSRPDDGQLYINKDMRFGILPTLDLNGEL